MLQLRNPYIFAPIKLGYSDGSGIVTQRHIDFYRRRSHYLGAIISEPLYLDKGLREIPAQMGIDADDKITGLLTLTEAIHAGGCKAIAHLNHPGRMANPKIPGNYHISSTDQACENGGAAPRRMEREERDQVIDLFVNASRRAEQAGFDILELQLGHGYLLAQFLSPAVNDRTDAYGGSLENRLRFPLEVLREVQRQSTLPIIVRVSGDEMIPNGIKLNETIELASILRTMGVAAAHVSAGTVCSTPPWFFQHMFVPKGKTWEMAAKVKEATDIPLVFVGRVDSSEDILKLEKTFKADYIAIGRGLIADPDMVGKHLGQVSGSIAPCMACAEGCLGGVRGGKGLHCLVNPQVGDAEIAIPKAEQSKRYAVVGGGLAGMEAAIILSERGHLVDLFEKQQLGGQFNLAPLTPHKTAMAALVPYLEERLQETGVSVLHEEATPDKLLGRYDAVLLATGSAPTIPAIEGLTTYSWAEILLPENLPEGKHILIIGGGLIGVDIATALIPRNNRVTIVKRTEDFGEDMELIAKNLSLKMMKEKQVFMSDHTHITRVEERTVHALRDGEPMHFDEVDLIVVSAGMQSYNPLEGALQDKLPLYVIGDARTVGKAQDAIADGYRTALTL